MKTTTLLRHVLAFVAAAVLAGTALAGQNCEPRRPTLDTMRRDLALAASVATQLDVIREEGLLERSRRLGAQALERLRRGCSVLPAVGEVRGLGLLLGIELVDTVGRSAADLAEEVLYRCLSAGLSFKIGQGHVLVLAPPLNVAEADLDWALDLLLKELGEAALP